MIPLFAIIVTPITAKVTADWLREQYHQNRLGSVDANIFKINSSSNGLVWVFAGVLLAAMLLTSGKTIDPEGRGNVFDKRFFPVEAVSWLETHPQDGYMFNEFDWGGYLLLRLWPEQQIFMDGHTHIYGEGLTREYEQVITLSTGWEKVLQKYDIGWVIMRKNARLVDALQASGNWETAYEDTTAIVLVRK
jgi:hypothetical protein